MPYEYVESYSTEEMKKYSKVGLSMQELLNYFSYLAPQYLDGPGIKVLEIFRSDIFYEVMINDLLLYKLKDNITDDKLDEYLDLANKDSIISTLNKYDGTEENLIRKEYLKIKKL